MFKLALAMGRTVAELGDMDINEFIEWMAFNELDPIGEWRADTRAALICDTLAKIAGNRESKLSDFMLTFDAQEERRSSVDDMKARMMMAALIQKAHVEALNQKKKPD